MASTRNTKFIEATPEKIYQAFTDPKALEHWLVPGEMTGKIHSFDLRENGGYEMSLYYPDNDKASKGKSGTKEDRYTAKFIKLNPPETIIAGITFQTDDPELSGEMIERVTLQQEGDGTLVTIVFDNIPKGIKPKDNEEGTASSLDKLAVYLQN
jgi:uncharacterized protein YndB with AHSA1/START domain